MTDPHIRNNLIQRKNLKQALTAEDNIHLGKKEYDVICGVK